MKKWVARVQDVYSSLAELEQYDRIYGVVARCKYKSAKDLWEDDPLISGSVNPRDFGLATLKDIKNRCDYSFGRLRK